MSAAVQPAEDPLLDGYRQRAWSGPGRTAGDELVTADGLRPGQEALAASLASLGLAGLLAARAETQHLLADEGITFGPGGPDGDAAGAWRVDPIPVLLAPGDWAGLERGLLQRTVVLDALLADLYGPRTLLRRRVVPPELVLAHDGYIRQADGIGAPGRRQLVLSSTDVARTSAGWRVLGDRTQLAGGAGYTMATRRIITRVMAGLHRGADVARLRGFFHTMTAALQDASPAAVEPPRVVLLSPGPASDTAFEQAYLATLLGFPLVEADDLVMERGRVWLRASGRLEQVDVVLRRVDAAWADPLELRGDSELGVPGLIEATRARTVAVVNPIGSGVLENPALLGLLPEVARALLDEELRLSGPATWWCGDETARSHVLTHLPSLTLRPISATLGPARHGWLLSAAERDDLAARIDAQPWLWCGEEALEPSTVPVVTPAGLEPRPFVLRTFGVAHGDDYHFLPGGLGRALGALPGTGPGGAEATLAKDVWVLDSGAAAWAPAEQRRLNVRPIAKPSGLSPRVADHLFSMGRWAERAETTARVAMVTGDFAEDHAARPDSAGALALGVLLDAVAEVTQTAPPPPDAPPVDHLRRLVLDGSWRGTVRFAARRLVATAQHIRDLLSLDTWSVLGRLDRTLAAPPAADEQLQPLLADVLESLLALAGIMAHSMVRDATWALLDGGCRLERALLTLGLLRRTIDRPRAAEVEALVVEGVLRAGESVITHRRRAAAGTGPSAPVESAIDLLLLDPVNPRSVLFSVRSLADDLRLLGDEAAGARTDALALRLAGADVADLQAGGREHLTALLEASAEELRGVAAGLAARHFVRQAPRHAQAPGWARPWQVTP